MIWFYVMAAALGALAACAVLGAVYLPRVHELINDRNQWRMLAAELAGKLARYEPDDVGDEVRVLYSSTEQLTRQEREQYGDGSW